MTLKNWHGSTKSVFAKFRQKKAARLSEGLCCSLVLPLSKMFCFNIECFGLAREDLFVQYVVVKAPCFESQFLLFQEDSKNENKLWKLGLRTVSRERVINGSENVFSDIALASLSPFDLVQGAISEMWFTEPFTLPFPRVVCTTSSTQVPCKNEIDNQTGEIYFRYLGPKYMRHILTKMYICGALIYLRISVSHRVEQNYVELLKCFCFWW